jgi:hypothetical protein
MKVVTYATHSFGTFEEIIGNPYGVHVDVLGFGTKWTGFMDKIKGVYTYCKALPEDEIVVFIDGFDSEILKPLTGLEKTFRDLDCGVLLSKHRTYETLYAPTKQIFGTCKNVIANSGLYMGTVGHLKMFLKLVLDEEMSDDQTNFNTVCSQFDWVKVDDDNRIFYNVIPGESKTNVPDHVYFKSYPGDLSVERWTRAVGEYYPFFMREISLVLLIATLILFMWKM